MQIQSTVSYPSRQNTSGQSSNFAGDQQQTSQRIYNSYAQQIGQKASPAIMSSIDVPLPCDNSEVGEPYNAGLVLSNGYESHTGMFNKARCSQIPFNDDFRVSGSSSSSRAQLGSSSSLVHSQSTSTAQLSGSQLGVRYSAVASYDPKRAKAKPVDLSHLYLVNNKDSVTLTQTNESVANYSHKMISECLGKECSTVLVPRLKSLEMYKKNVKKSKDPDVLFQYAQYMLQTALTMDINPFQSEDWIAGLSPDSKQPKDILKDQFLKEAKLYLTKLSVKGYKDAQYLLADAYSSGAFGKVNHKDAFILFQSSAKHAHVEAAYRTAVCFEKGLGTTRDSRKCIEFLKFAASRNHPAAMFKLGLYSFHGRMGLPQDVNTKQNGIKWLSRASARANELTCAAPYELAQIYEKGFLDIVIPDDSYATELYVQAASLGHIPSTTRLAKLYEQGNEVVPQDTSLSVHYYTQAALKGDPEAMLGLCAWYLVGAHPAFERNDREAFQWALRAAKKGYGKAQFTVGYFHEYGKGCKQDLDMAYKWYECAADNNDPRAIKKLESRRPTKKRSSTVFNFSFLKADDIERPSRIDLAEVSPLYLDFYGGDAKTLDPPHDSDIDGSFSYDVLNVITDDENSLDIDFHDPRFTLSIQQQSLTPISRTTSSLMLESPFRSCNNDMVPTESHTSDSKQIGTGQTSNSSTSDAKLGANKPMVPPNNSIPRERWRVSSINEDVLSSKENEK
ncbi:tetratricopeptide repeat protein Ecym_4689 [Eremothecium cymbalariae DBVPG|uniref:Activator of C kinase protein 1 n=1 Tax=Eremothecium cymbalariae (strain CBS 270.75 / DBVPG 7215 / KCTC 17166 / NRRL Y-17582) TaxID=931890 RepID=G8JSI8_ERECY|nr:hypothetical protein Ecym_4689 [Eremothecium cymbalariae DBVPG\